MTIGFKKWVAVIALIMFLGACGEKHRAQVVVNDFLDEHLKEASHYDKIYGVLDSTSRITQEAIKTMRAKAAQLPVFKSDLSYGEGNGTLFYLRVKLCERQDTMPLTFYLDKDMSRVVAFKEN